MLDPEDCTWEECVYDAPDKFFENANDILNVIDPPYGCELDDLSKEIWYKFEDNRQTIYDFTNKINLWRNLNNHIRKSSPDHGFYLGGSTLNGFGLKNSDADLTILEKHTNNKSRNRVAHLNKFKTLINNYQYLTSSNLLKGFVPMLRIKESFSKLKVDITYNCRVLIHNTYLLSCYSQVDWRVQPLGIAIKLWAKYHAVTSKKYTALVSYHLILMLIHFLQDAVQPPILPCLHNIFKNKFVQRKNNTLSNNFFKKLEIPFEAFCPSNQQSLGDLLIEFFHYYSEFNFNNYAISIKLGCAMPKEELYHAMKRRKAYKPDQQFAIFIEEPYELRNACKGIRKQANRIKIQEQFKTAYLALKETGKLSSIFQNQKKSPNDDVQHSE